MSVVDSSDQSGQSGLHALMLPGDTVSCVALARFDAVAQLIQCTQKVLDRQAGIQLDSC